MGFGEMIILSVSLCADCFAVSLCSAVTLKKIELHRLVLTALSFAFVQAGLMFAGWAFGDLLMSFVSGFSNIIGFVLLLYVGGSMIADGVRCAGEAHDLNVWKNIVLGALATSVDALAVGISLSMGSIKGTEIIVQTVSVFAVTLIAVVSGIFGGKKIGKYAGRIAQIAGGFVLMTIGILILF